MDARIIITGIASVHRGVTEVMRLHAVAFNFIKGDIILREGQTSENHEKE